MFLSLSLDQPPRIVQAGLSLHGYHRKETFQMHDVWGLHLYLYEGVLRAQNSSFHLLHGSVSLTPPGVELEWEFPAHAPHYYAHFVPGTGEEHVVPWLYGPLVEVDRAVVDMELIGSVWREEPAAASARLWDFLHRLIRAEVPPLHSAGALPATVQIAVSHIAQNLSRRIYISDLAQLVGVSHNYLITLFRKSFGGTVEDYIRQRRGERARFLLENSSLAIKSIAQEVGLPDLNHFNKVIRRVFGCPPSVLRTLSRQKPLVQFPVPNNVLP